jgi:calcineurin-like phosphoesterase family protein
MNYFVTSDEHHGHEGIIRLCNRPFANVREMSDSIIDRHNAKVRQASNPLTIHVGDMFWKTLSTEDVCSIMRRMLGRHAYVAGNHEEVFERGDGLKNFFSMWEQRTQFKHNKRFYVLDHYAGRVWNKSHRGSVLLYGHSHGELPELGRSFDIGVDCHNFEPWTMAELEAKAVTLKPHHVIPVDKLVPGTGAHKDWAAEQAADCEKKYNELPAWKK